MTGEVVLIGTGSMARQYVDALGAEHFSLAIGNTRQSCEAFTSLTGIVSQPGGVERFAGSLDGRPVICVTPVNSLADATVHAIALGAGPILLEKPGAATSNQLGELRQIVGQHPCWVAYNRRYFECVSRLAEIADTEGGPATLRYEFTEFGHRIGQTDHPGSVKQNWILANSSHVIDLAHFLGGKPVQLAAHASGALDWHSAGRTFSGGGKTDKGATFSYTADWLATGSWVVELTTMAGRRYRLAPLEKLGRLMSAPDHWEVIHEEPTKNGKPGLKRMVESFMGSPSDLLLPTLAEHSDFASEVLDVIAGSTSGAG